MDLKFEGCGPNYMVFFVFGSLEIVFVVYLLSEVCYKMLLVCCHFFLLNACMLSLFHINGVRPQVIIIDMQTSF